MNNTVGNKLDVVTIGRSSIDLYSQNVVADFIDINGFDAYVGGSPRNIAVGCRRLGLKSALLTAVGEDKVKDFILNFLEKNNFSIAWYRVNSSNLFDLGFISTG